MRKHLLIAVLMLAILVSLTAGTMAVYANARAAIGKQAEAGLSDPGAQSASAPAILADAAIGASPSNAQ